MVRGALSCTAVSLMTHTDKDIERTIGTRMQDRETHTQRESHMHTRMHRHRQTDRANVWWWVRLVALQFPEGLLMFACTIADILETYVSERIA